MVEARPTVCVTGMGALIGQGIATSLRADGRTTILGVDRRGSLRGARLCEGLNIKPACSEDDPAYLSFWSDLIERNAVRLVLPGIGVDMEFLNRNRSFFAERGVVLGLNTPGLIDLCRDKLVFHEHMGALDLPRIPTAIPDTWEQACRLLGPPPFLLKPRRGEGSAGHRILQSEQDFAYWTVEAGENWLLQRLVGRDDDEYTVGAFGLGNGAYIDEMIIMRRRLTRAGNTGEAQVVDHPAVLAASRAILRFLEPVGPTNLQFRVEGETPYLLEVNPRFSSSLSLRAAFGFDEAAMALDFWLEGRRPTPPRVLKGRAERYWADEVMHVGGDL